jgi:hypothetical protein
MQSKLTSKTILFPSLSLCILSQDSSGVLDHELQPEFNAFHYASSGGEDEDGSATVAEMVGRALTVWREVRAVGRSEMHDNR